MKTFRIRLHVIEKSTRRSWLAFFPWEDGIALCAMTGSMRFVGSGGGYSEFNDRGEPVLDSWIEPRPLVRIAIE